jgi:heme A synthase
VSTWRCPDKPLVRNPISTDLCQRNYCSSLTAVGFDSVFLTFDRRRQTDQYRLISAAVGVLVLRSLIGAGTVLGAVPMPVHHFVEHSFDFLIAAMILYAVYAHAPGSLGEDVTSD